MGYINDQFTKWLYKNSQNEGLLIQSGGSIKSVGSSVLWDDLKVNPTSGSVIGAVSPDYKIISTDGSASSGVGYHFNGSTSEGHINYYSDLNTSNMSIALWINADNAQDR